MIDESEVKLIEAVERFIPIILATVPALILILGIAFCSIPIIVICTVVLIQNVAFYDVYDFRR